jgi:hypothetical protein
LATQAVVRQCRVGAAGHCSSAPQGLMGGCRCQSKFWLTPSRWRRLPDHLHVLPLMVARGCARLSFLHSAAEAIGDLDVPVSSQCRRKDRKVSTRRRDLFRAPRRHRHPEPDRVFDLPSGRRSNRPEFEEFRRRVQVEVDAIEPPFSARLSRMRSTITLPKEQFDTLKAAEASARCSGR